MPRAAGRRWPSIAALGLRAARLLGAASALRRSIGARPSTDEADATAIYDTVRDALGQDGLAAGIAEGESWTLGAAMAEATEIALGLVRPAPHRRRPVRRRSSVPTPAARRLGLTARELEVLGYLVQRYTDREIAGALTISLRTVTTHVGRILTKLGVEGRRQAAIEAARLGLLAS